MPCRSVWGVSQHALQVSPGGLQFVGLQFFGGSPIFRWSPFLGGGWLRGAGGVVEGGLRGDEGG